MKIQPKQSFVFLLLLIVLVGGELDTSDINNRLNSLGIDPENAPTAEQGQKVFEDQCRKYGGDAAVEGGKVAQQEMVQCVQRLINVTQVQQEIETAKPTGDLDVVFKKYCKKTPDLLNCATNLTKGIEPCLAEDQKRLSGIVHDVAKTLLNFTCYKEGDRIALFIAEGGPQCLESKQTEIQACINATFGKYAENIPGPDVNITDISNLNFPIFLFDEGQCKDIEEVSRCVVKSLELCKDPTPANVVESILKVIRKVIPCQHTQESNPDVRTAGPLGETNAATSAQTLSLFLITFLLIKLSFL